MSASFRAASGRRTVLVVTVVVLLAIGAGLWFWVIKPSSGTAPVADMPPGPPGAPGGPGGPGGGQPVTVSVSPVLKGAFPVLVRAVGNVTPYNTVTVVPQVEGWLLRVHFREGDRVKAGDLLAELDARALEASLAEARATQAQNQAELKNAQADLARYQRLFRQDSVARQQLDTQQALVRQLQARSAADQAKVDSARVQLGYTKIHAPVSGRLGLIKTNVGAMIGPSTTDGLVSIVQVDPISVVFGVPEVQLQSLRDAMAQQDMSGGLEVQAWDRTESRLLATGRLTTLDNQIDTTTGALRVRARFDNPGEQLFPNQFVNVRLTLQTLPGALSVPVDVVQFGNQGNYVYVVRDGKAHIQTVKLGASASDRVQVVDGLQAGEQVVLEGMDSLRDGSRVKIVAPVEGDPDALLGGTPDETAGKPAPAAGHAAPAGGNAESAGGNVGPAGGDAQHAGNAQPAGDAGPGGDAPPEP
jgi:efflux transporter, RND family, MFP subunit